MPFITIPTLKSETFTANDTWQPPPGVYSAIVIGCGGGAGGKGAGQNGQNGGAGAPVITQTISVSPGTVYNINIGAGGAGGAGAGGSGITTGAFGDDGGDTTIDDGVTTLATFPGAPGDSSTSSALPEFFGTQGEKYSDGMGGFRAQDSFYAQGGPAGTGGTTLVIGGGGGAAFATGGAGGDFTAVGGDDPGEDGFPGSQGSGGGGGSACTGTIQSGGDGGDGGDGKVIIYYFQVRTP